MDVAANIAEARWSAAAAAAATAEATAAEDEEDGDEADEAADDDPVELRRSDVEADVGRADAASLPYLMVTLRLELGLWLGPRLRECCTQGLAPTSAVFALIRTKLKSISSTVERNFA